MVDLQFLYTSAVSQPSAPPGPAIEAAGLGKVFRRSEGWLRRRRSDHVALEGLDIRVERGELFGLLGPNGAGKTTTTKILTTLLLPSAGTARVLGLDVQRQTRALRHRIGFVFGGERGLYWRLSGLDNLRYFADLYQLDAAISRRRIAEVLGLVGLAGREHERVEHYSRGMKQRLHIARGLLNEPEVLFLDEPTIGIDPVGARELRLLLRSLVEGGTTIFLTTHYMFEADQICDRVAVINRGRLVAEGTPGSLKKQVMGEAVVEFEVEGLTPDQVGRLRLLPGVSSVFVAERELTQLVSVHCAQPVELMVQLETVLDGVPHRPPIAREPTLEDAYVRLVSE